MEKRAALEQNREQERDEQDRRGREAGQPTGDDRRETEAAGELGVEGLFDRRSLHHSGRTAEPAADHHRDDGDFRDVHPGVAGGRLAFAEHRDLIAEFGAPQ